MRKIALILLLMLAVLSTFASGQTTVIASGDASDPWKPCWTHGSWGSIPGAKWVWPTYHPRDTENEETQTGLREFTINCNPTSGYLWIDADNEYAAKLNSADVKGGPINGTNLMQANTLEITVTNYPMPGSNYETNPAGLIYKLEVSCDTVTGQNSIPIGSTEGTGGVGAAGLAGRIPIGTVLSGSPPPIDTKCGSQGIVGSWDWLVDDTQINEKVIAFPNGALEAYPVGSDKVINTGMWTLVDTEDYFLKWDTGPSVTVSLYSDDCKFFEGVNDLGQLVTAMRTEVPSPILTGTWEMTTRPGLPCRIMQKGDALTFVNEKGDESSGMFLGPSNVIADDWGHLRGTVSTDESSIVWDDGSTWVKKSDYLGY